MRNLTTDEQQVVNGAILPAVIIAVRVGMTAWAAYDAYQIGKEIGEAVSGGGDD